MFRIILAILLVFSLAISFFAVLQVFSSISASSQGVSSQGASSIGASIIQITSSSVGSTLQAIQENSIVLSTVSWLLVGILLLWRGRTKSAWRRVGLDIQVFKLFVKMRGGTTRLNLLRSLSSPKDRAQLASDLGLDWKTIDRHVQILNKHGFVREHAVYGNIKVYELTSLGMILLQLINDLQEDASGRT